MNLRLLLSIGLIGASAWADTIFTTSPIQPLPITPTAITVPLTFSPFNTSRGVLDSVDITVTLVASFNVVFLNALPTPQFVQFFGIAGPDELVIGPLPWVIPPLTVTSPAAVSLAPGTVSLSATAFGTATYSAPSPFFSTFTANPIVVLPFYETGSIVNYSALPILFSSSTIQGSVVVAYNYFPLLGSPAPGADTPEPASLALISAGVIAIILRRRFASRL